MIKIELTQDEIEYLRELLGTQKLEFNGSSIYKKKGAKELLDNLIDNEVLPKDFKMDIQEYITEKEYQIELVYKLEGRSGIEIRNSGYRDEMILSLSKLVNGFRCGTIKISSDSFKEIKSILSDDAIDLNRVGRLLEILGV